MSTTVELPGVGPVPALPAELTPLVSYAAGMPIGQYAVIAWAPDGYPLAIGTKWTSPSQVDAQHLADVAVARFPSCTVYVTRHHLGAVTIHRPDLGHAGHLLGTALVDDHDAVPAESGAEQIWQRIITYTSTDPGERRIHDQAVMDALRLAHHLPAGTQDGEVFYEIACAPRPAGAYLRAYLRVLGGTDALRENAKHRTPTHRPPTHRPNR